MKVVVNIPVEYTTTIDIPDECLTQDQIDELTNEFVENLHNDIRGIHCINVVGDQLDKIEEYINNIPDFNVKDVDNTFDNYIYYKE